MEEMGNYVPLYPEGTAILSVGIAHQNGSTVPDVSVPPPVLAPELLQQALNAWLEELDLGEVPRSLLGYSLGGRIALALFERRPEAWSGMTLLAADGFKKNPMYRFAVETALGRATWSWVDRRADTVRSVIRGFENSDLSLPTSNTLRCTIPRTTPCANSWPTRGKRTDNSAAARPHRGRVACTP